MQIANNGDLCVAVDSTQGPWEKYDERKFRSFLYRSNDGGTTWSDPLRLADWNGIDGGYPSSVERTGGQIVKAYCCSALSGDPPDFIKNDHVEVIVWDPERSFATK